MALQAPRLEKGESKWKFWQLKFSRRVALSSRAGQLGSKISEVMSPVTTFRVIREVLSWLGLNNRVDTWGSPNRVKCNEGANELPFTKL